MVLLFLSFSVTGFAEETIRIATGEWPPYVSKDLKHNGLVFRIIREAFLLEGIKVKVRFFPWARSMMYAKMGEWDATAPWTPNPEREKDFYFSDPFVSEKIVFFHLKSYQFNWKTIDDLKGITIGGTLSYNYGEIFERAEKEGSIRVDRVPRNVQNFKKLLLGRIQTTPYDIEAGYNIINKNLKRQQISSVTHHPQALTESSLSVLFSKKVEKNKRLLILFNKGLKRLRKSKKMEHYFEESRRGEYIIIKK